MENKNNKKPEKPQISLNDFKQEVEKLLSNPKPTKHTDVLKLLIEEVAKFNYRDKVEHIEEGEKLLRKHYIVLCIEYLLQIATDNNWGLCKNNHSYYLYNGQYWDTISIPELKIFIGLAAEKTGIYKIDARHYVYQEELYKQFSSQAYLPKPNKSNEEVLLNVQNGTYAISLENQELRPHDREDFMTYIMPFGFDPKAQAPRFQEYLDRVQPDIDCQMILAEYIAYLFIKPSTLKLEKVLLLYGKGSNGKSVFFEIVNALLGGSKNVTCYSLQNLTQDRGYCRARLADCLVNYASEINGKLETSIFKQLVSGEPVEARLPYCEPFTLTNYGKLIFNCNELPKEVEQSHAYFRRFLIVPFDVTIPDEDQDKDLHKKIIENELSGVFNWVLEGLKRLLAQKGFTKSNAVEKQLEEYKHQSDTVKLFIEDIGYAKSTTTTRMFSYVYTQYKAFCTEDGYYPCSKKTFGERLRNEGYNVAKTNKGMVIFLSTEVAD